MRRWILAILALAILIAVWGCSTTPSSKASKTSRTDPKAVAVATNVASTEEFERTDEAPILVGTWGRLILILFHDRSPEAYKFGYNEFTFSSDGRVVIEGWQLGAYFKVEGRYTIEQDRIHFTDKRIISDKDDASHLIWVEWLGLPETRGQYQFIGSNFVYAKGVRYDINRRGYYDADGDAVKAADP